MKRSAPSSQRTGQPRWVQLAEKAMKLSSVTRRSQTPLFAVTPAQGSDEGSVTVTATVFPIWKSSGLPIVHHYRGPFRKKGARMNPTNGTPTIAVQSPTRPMESFSKNRRLLISSAVSVGGAGDESLRLVFMANLCDPTAQRCREKGNTDQPKNPGGDQTPEEKGDSHGWSGVEGGRVRDGRYGR